MKKPKQSLTVRVSPDVLAQLKKCGANLSQIINEALEKASGEGRCPSCNQKIKKT